MCISYILTLEPEGEKNGSFAFPGGTFPGICSYITIITSKCNKWYCCGIKKNEYICGMIFFLTNAYGKPELYHEGDNPSVGT